MYPHELTEYLALRNHELCISDVFKAISLKENPQLTHVKYEPFDNAYSMWDKYGNYYHFRCKGESK